MARASVAVIAALAASACAQASQPIRIGAKEFTEQTVLAEIVRGLIEDQLGIAARAVPCGDTFGCQQALRSGQIDLMVEYSGTGSLYADSPGAAEEISLDALRARYRPFGLEWLGPLGFDNSYRLVVPSHLAQSRGIRTILDLAALEPGVRVACPSAYLRRTRDGFASLLVQHGLRHRGQPLAIDDPFERLQAVAQGRADVAVVFATDGALPGFEVTALDDTLGFFPPYEAAIVARQEVLTRVAALAGVLARLEGTLDGEAMRGLNYAVEVEGWAPELVARRFLRARQLAVDRDGQRLAAHITVAVAAADDLDPHVTRAVRAVRAVFSDRSVRVERTDDAVRRISGGVARLGVVGAERFFRVRGGAVTRLEEIEAVAVLGTRQVHVLRRSGEPRGTAPLAGRVGLPPRDSGAGAVGEAILRSHGTRAHTFAEPATVLRLLAEGELDAALLLSEPGDAAVAAAIAGSNLALFGIAPRDRPEVTPYLLPARIAAGTYAGQGEAVETLGAQVLLVGPRRPSRAVLAEGPLGALTVGLAPVTVEEAEALVEASGVPETPDPMLPSVWTTWPHGVVAADPGAAPHRIDTLLTILAIAYLVWLAVMVIRRPEE